MKQIIILQILLQLSLSLYSKSGLDSLFLELDEAIGHKNDYEKDKQTHIHNLKQLLIENNLSLNEELKITNQLVEAYKPYNFDSTLAYIQQYLKFANKTNNVGLIAEGKVNLSQVLASSGRYIEALDALKSVNYNELKHEFRVKYLLIHEQIYSDLFVYTTSQEASDNYRQLSNAYTDSLLQILDEDSDLYLSIKEKRYRDSRDLEMCKKINTRRLAMAKMGTREYSLVTFERSLIYELNGKRELEKKFLILSAISDIRATVKDNASLTRIALLLYQEGEIDRAYQYIKISFDDANFYNSRLRFISISEVLPLITSAYQAKSNSQNKKLSFFLLLISVLSIILIIALTIIRRQLIKNSRKQKELEVLNKQTEDINNNLRKTNEKLREMNNAFQEASKVKEHYIGSFLAICSDYIDKLDSYRKMVNKHIRDKEVEELFIKTKSSQLLEDEMKEFYENFDHTFLHIFPNFVEKFNELLTEDAQIHLSDPNKLNTELRIFALVRLGITDSSKIASLLRYSISTIYNYRVKIRNASKVPREEFKDYVMKIDVSDNILD